MASDSQTSTQVSQPRHSSSFTGSDFPSTNSNTPAGQEPTHSSQPVHLSLSTTTSNIAFLLGSGSPTSPFIKVTSRLIMYKLHVLTSAKIPLIFLVSIFFLHDPLSRIFPCVQPAFFAGSTKKIIIRQSIKKTASPPFFFTPFPDVHNKKISIS